MKIAKLIQNGENQVVCLPDGFRFEGDGVYLKRIGNAMVLLPHQNTWEPLLDSLSLFSVDYMSERTQLPE